MARHRSGGENVIRVLYVDDDHHNLQVAKAFLEMEPDLDVTTVSDARTASDMVISGGFDVVVSDMLMPGMDGIELLRDIRGHGCRTPFIIISARGREDVVLEAFTEGADYYVQKGGEQRSQFLELAGKIRKSHESLVKERELSRLKAATEATIDGIVIFDADMRIGYANNAAVKILDSQHQDDLIGTSLGSLFSSPGDEHVYRTFKEELERKGHHFMRRNIISKGGDELTVEASFNTLADGGAILVIRDITEVQKARLDAEENARRNEESRRLLESVLQTQTEMICRFLPDTTLTYVNDAYCRYFQSSPKGLIGKRFLEFIPDLWHGSILQNISQLTPDNPSFNYAHEVKRSDGDVGWQEWTDTAIFSPDGELLFIQSVGRDITESVLSKEENDRQSHLKEILIEILSDFIRCRFEGYEQAIQDSLRQLGEFVGVDRAYIFDYDFRNKVCSNTYEWCQDGIEPQIRNLQRVPLSGIEDWTRRHRSGETIHIPDVDSFPNPVERSILEAQGVKGLLTIPLMDADGCKGFIGFDSVKRPREFTPSEISTLKVFADILMVIWSRIEADRDLRHVHELNRAMIDNYPDVVYATDLFGNILHISENVRDILGYTPEELKDMGLDFIIGPEEGLLRNTYLHQLQDRIDTGDVEHVIDLPVEILTKDGAVVKAETSSRLHRDNDGRWILIGFARQVV